MTLLAPRVVLGRNSENSHGGAGGGAWSTREVDVAAHVGRHAQLLRLDGGEGLRSRCEPRGFGHGDEALLDVFSNLAVGSRENRPVLPGRHVDPAAHDHRTRLARQRCHPFAHAIPVRRSDEDAVLGPHHDSRAVSSGAPGETFQAR